MLCAWKPLLSILPGGIAGQLTDTGTEQELRLRMNAPPELVGAEGSKWLRGNVRGEDLAYVVNAASRYSPWCAKTMAQGYLTAPGGHRIGICGVYSAAGSFQEITSLCIRIARDVPGVAQKLGYLSGSVLILGAPGWGKTTLLRDLARQLSQSQTVCVVDERGELFPEGIARGKRMDILTGCPKPQGMEMLLRTMAPAYIAVDEITAEADCLGLTQAANCGVKLLATAHAADLQDLKQRRLYRELPRIFQTCVQLHRDKTYSVERMTL